MYNINNNIVSLRNNKTQLVQPIQPIPLNDTRRKLVGKVILFTNARDEKNIKEWVAHHILLGFDLIYIFDHKSIKPISHEVKKFKKGVIVERCEMEGAIKIPLMLRASKIATSAGADWMLYLDADEFLVLNAFQHVKQMLKYYLMADSLAINWLMFGTNNHRKEPKNGLIIENYTKSDALIDKHVKTFVRPSQVIDAITPHYFIIVNSGRMVSLNMKPMGNSQSFNEWPIEYNKCAAFVAHYVYQSEESYIKRKINLPRDDNSLYRTIEENIHSKYNSSNNEFVKNKYANSIKLLLEKIKNN